MPTVQLDQADEHMQLSSQHGGFSSCGMMAADYGDSAAVSRRPERKGRVAGRPLAHSEPIVKCSYLCYLLANGRWKIPSSCITLIR